MKREKILFVSYTSITGGLTFLGYTICVGTRRQKEENIIDKHFKRFYGKICFLKEGYEKTISYMYFTTASIGVKEISWKEITQEQLDLLNSLGIV